MSELLIGRCEDTLKSIASDSVDCIVTDPPYGYSFMGLNWDKALPSLESLQECLRVLKPGAFGFFMCTPRQDCLGEMIHLLNKAGFETGFSSIYWCYATGFLKASNTSKLIDKRAGVEREIVGKNPCARPNSDYVYDSVYSTCIHAENITIPSTPEAKALEGAYSGFQPKPATEIILVVMKPLSEKSYIDQALKNGHGVTWLGDCKIPYAGQMDISEPRIRTKNAHPMDWDNELNEKEFKPDNNGRFPANLLVSDNVLDDGDRSNCRVKDGSYKERNTIRSILNTQEDDPFYSIGKQRLNKEISLNDDYGSFSRFFDLDAWFRSKLPEQAQRTYPALIVPKPCASEKNKHAINKHPTVKPIKLMSYLITMGSRENDVILDPFCGSGTTGEAARLLNRQFIGCELDPQWAELIAARAGIRSYVPTAIEEEDLLEEWI